jgi:hypothetical protein
MLVGKTDGSYPDYQLAQQVRNTAIGLAPADIGHPFAENGCVDERHPPEGIGDVRALCAYFEQRLMLYKCDPAGADRGQRAVKLCEMDALQVRKVAGYLERQYLPPAFAGHLEPASHSAEQETGARRPVAFAHDVLVRLQIGQLQRQPVHRDPVVVVELRDARELAQQQMGH